MKRAASTSLVSYASSDDETKPPVTAPKKRKLPPVAASIAPPAPVDDPSLHQGRTRTTPHVEGQFAAHVYISVPLRRHPHLHQLVQDILRDAREDTPALRDIWPSEDTAARSELHISLSRPIFLRAHQRDDLKRAVKNIAKAHKAFIVSFATLSELINDEKTRAFLTLEVGAGHHELRSLADALSPALQAIRQQEYYVNPRFHASIAWALLHNGSRASELQAARSDSICTALAPSEDEAASLSLTGPTQETPTDSFPTLAKLSPELINVLNERYASQLCATTVGTFVVQAISVKIGKDLSSWRLIGL